MTIAPRADTSDAATTTGSSVLDNIVHAALRSRHARFALRHGRVARYQDGVSPFIAMPSDPAEQDWHDLAALVRRTGGGPLALPVGVALPDSWTAEHHLDVRSMRLVQLTGADLRAEAADPEVRELTFEDVPAMLDLTARTRPGPFGARTIELGGYVGIWRDGVLAAMAGERFAASESDGRGWAEVSAVCTDPAFRGQGMATRLIRVIAGRMRARGDEIFLHVIDTNTGAIALYEHIGFTVRMRAANAVLGPTA